MAGRPLACMMACAFSPAFSAKVVPVSSTSISTPTSDGHDHLHAQLAQNGLHLRQLALVM